MQKYVEVDGVLDGGRSVLTFLTLITYIFQK